ncbi:hypothetical protein BCON_0272g00020 [Botryotinia convoluta]|uniref:ATP phosphoribosyltransferase n=1 Tax=Botryotinia convoluta TaxID=54673 RepID=A0A4Z1HEX5_9HELO|nr:hypothetical protein BCON_0272g00020 [Botryotinia convoluta]
MSTSSTSQARYKLVYRVLQSHLSATKDAIFAVGGGVYADGKYIKVWFGQFLPVVEKGAVPHTGKVGVLEQTEEVLVHILYTGEEVTRKAVEALKRTHPYEEVSYEVYKLENF